MIIDTSPTAKNGIANWETTPLYDGWTRAVILTVR
jgi:hypothetical protein